MSNDDLKKQNNGGKQKEGVGTEGDIGLTPEAIDSASLSVPLRLCEVVVEAIKFKHGFHCFHCDAFTIPIATTPEWVRGRIHPENLPVTYSIKKIKEKPISIWVNFFAFILDKNIESVEIKAEGGGILGPIDVQAVQFHNGISVPDFVVFPLNYQKIAFAGPLSENIVWKWQCRCSCNGKWESIGSTNHKIIIVD
jgi:hypothetical protein